MPVVGRPGVFSGPGGLNPDYDPRDQLLQSGDVERNPGPVGGGACHSCGNLPRAGTSPLRCVGGCGRVSHRKFDCSGLRRAAQGQGTWRCPPCSGASVNPPSAQPSVTATAGSLGGRKALRCPVCSVPVRPHRLPLICSVCGLGHHRKRECSGLTRDEATWWAQHGMWKCTRCKAAPTSDSSTQPGTRIVDRRVDLTKRAALRVLQWNVDGIHTSVADLRQLLKEEKVDVCLVQESKLSARGPTPRIDGFASVRRDRPSGSAAGGRGGGLLTYVKEDIPFRVTEAYRPHAEVGVVEAQAIEVRTGRGERLVISNVYVPPPRGADAAGFDPEVLSVSDRHIFGGDFNAHSALWEDSQPGDGRGEALESWCVDKGLGCCNDGSTTRVDRISGSGSSLDITLVSMPLLERVEWRVLSPRGSDHLPVLSEIHLNVGCLVAHDGALKWDWTSADWKAYGDAVDQTVSEGWTQALDWSLKQKVNFLREAMLKAAKDHIGQVRPKRPGREWMTKELAAAIRKRNALGRRIAERRGEWVAACREVSRLTAEAKQAAWKRFVGSLEEHASSTSAWRVIRSLSGRAPATVERNEVLVHEGREYHTASRKADAFVQHYAEVSRHKFTAEERRKDRAIRRRLFEAGRRLGPWGRECSDFSVAEFEVALRAGKSGGAEGADGISPRFLKGLGKVAKEFTLNCLNHSWREGQCPQSWRDAVIVPVLKGGKPAGAIDSYRPISLTSCLGKVLERMVANRIKHLAESQGLWCEDQSGFRGLRSAEDQVLRITQSVSDGFQNAPRSLRTVMALLDFSKAYDTVWREDLLDILLEAGIPFPYIRWIRGFLAGRQARVRLNGEVGRARLFRQGLPQGSVLSPLLFLFVIDGLRKRLPQGLSASFYADDVALWASHHRKEEAARLVEEGVREVWRWSREKKLSLNLSKCEVCFFSQAPQEGKWEPEVAVGDFRVRFNPNPVFLGVMYDRTLSFGCQAARAAVRLRQGARLLSALSGRQWGWHGGLLRRVYRSVPLSGARWCAAGWMPWLAATQLHVASWTALRTSV